MHREPRPGGAELELGDLAAACELVGDRWSLPVVAALLEGPLRYTELRERLPAIAPNILAARLRSLEDDGLVVSSRYSERPPRFDYRLTPDGEGLGDVARLLGSWAAGRGAATDAPAHDLCGTALELRWWCPSCRELAEPAGEDTVLA